MESVAPRASSILLVTQQKVHYTRSSLEARSQWAGKAEAVLHVKVSLAHVPPIDGRWRREGLITAAAASYIPTPPMVLSFRYGLTKRKTSMPNALCDGEAGHVNARRHAMGGVHVVQKAKMPELMSLLAAEKGCDRSGQRGHCVEPLRAVLCNLLHVRFLVAEVDCLERRWSGDGSRGR
jgi:hypothetical protein